MEVNRAYVYLPLFINPISGKI